MKSLFVSSKVESRIGPVDGFLQNLTGKDLRIVFNGLVETG